MKKVVLVLLLVCMILPMAVYAGPPEDVEGDFAYAPTGCDERWANDNQFLYCTDTGNWYDGDFLGTSEEEYVVILHGSQGGFVFETAFYKGTVMFEGTVGESAGTLEILFVGKSPGDINDWTGTWRIISGGGELANLHGQGIFYNNGPLDIHYEGQIHFAP